MRQNHPLTFGEARPGKGGGQSLVRGPGGGLHPGLGAVHAPAAGCESGPPGDSPDPSRSLCLPGLSSPHLASPGRSGYCAAPERAETLIEPALGLAACSPESPPCLGKLLGSAGLLQTPACQTKPIAPVST